MRDRLLELVALALGVVVVAVGAHACAEHLGYTSSSVMQQPVSSDVVGRR